MNSKIIPSIIAESQKEFDERFSKMKNISKVFHLDIMDGKFVKNRSLMFNLTLPRKKYQIHLMVNNPEKYIKIIYSKADTIIFHLESTKNPEKIIKFIRKKKKKVWIVLNPQTSVKKIEDYLGLIDGVLIMTVTPGKYGSKFQPAMLKKINQIKKLNPSIMVGVDGGVNDKTILKIHKAGADSFVSGSYLQNSKNPGKAIKSLMNLIK